MRGPPSPARSQRASLERTQPLVVVAIAAAFLFAVAFDDGGYAVASRSMWGIAAWWALALAAAVGWFRPPRLGRGTLLVAALLGALALVTLASAGWAANDARAFSEFNRVALYLGVFLLVSAAAPLAPIGRWCDAIAVALSAVAIVALLSRLLPERISDRGLSESFPAAATRLSFPVGYWNGLAILVALAVPLLLHRAATAGHAVPRALGVAPIPAIAATIYFASSRGGFATAAIGAVAFLLLGRNRWSITCALVAAAGGTAVVLPYLAAHPTVANEPLTAGGAERVEAALVIALGCVLSAAFHAIVSRLVVGRRVPQSVNAAAVAAVVLLAVVALVAAQPAERLAEFKEPPILDVASDDPVQAHLVSFRGSGRWQMWDSALEAWEDRPLIGHGAGSYEAWWTQYGSLALFVRDAHSLYLETLAELGTIGFAVLLAALGVGVGTAILRVRTAEHPDAVAAATATSVAFAGAAAIDWMWEVPAVTLVGVSCLAVAVAAPRRLAGDGSRRADIGRRLGPVVVALGIVLAQAVQLLADTAVRESWSAAGRGDVAAALAHAQRAKDVQPWAPEPWLQLALVHERRGAMADARDAIERAIREDRRDWRLWLVAARVHTKLGDIASARRSLARARALNPRSPLFADLDRG